GKKLTIVTACFPTAAAAFVCSATTGKLPGSHLNRLNWLPFKSALTVRRFEHFLQLLDVVNDAFNVHPPTV
ncbi:MAG TPA: hypothetical protein VMQ17_11590, partial [Candidatus Sulfotelmatobacter sp.]|nr:hypothetical protein [Candidatus Sulfotelmatobacter sp.]